MAMENGQVIVFVTELLCTHPYPILRGPRVFFFSLSRISFSSVMTTVANLRIKTALNSCRIPEGASCAYDPGLAFHYDSRHCLNVAGPDKPTLILPQILSKDILKSVWLFMQTSVAPSVHWLRQVMHHCS